MASPIRAEAVAGGVGEVEGDVPAAALDSGPGWNTDPSDRAVVPHEAVTTMATSSTSAANLVTVARLGRTARALSWAGWIAATRLVVP